MKIWKLFSVFAMSILLVAMLAACGGGSSADSATSAPTTAAPTSTPTTAAPISAPATAAPQGAGGCTTEDSCKNAAISITPKQVKPGGKVTITVKGWIANTDAVAVAVIRNSVGSVSSEGEAKSDAQGNLTATITIEETLNYQGPVDVRVVQVKGNDYTSNILTVSNKLTIIK